MSRTNVKELLGEVAMADGEHGNGEHVEEQGEQRERRVEQNGEQREGGVGESGIGGQHRHRRAMCTKIFLKIF